MSLTASIRAGMYGAMQPAGNSAPLAVAGNTINITGLDLATDGAYLIQLAVKNNGAVRDDFLMYANTDTTAANYGYEAFAADHATLGAARGAAAIIGSMEASAHCVGQILLMRDIDGRQRAFASLQRGPVSAIIMQEIRWVHNDTSNLTGLSFVTAQQFAAGSYAKAYKIGSALLSSSQMLAFSIYNKIVEWWETNNASGTTIVGSHAGLVATITGGTIGSTPIFSSLGNSIALTANTNKIQVPHSLPISMQGDMSLMVNFKRNGAQTTFPKIMWKSGINDALGRATYYLGLDNNTLGGRATFRITSGGVNYDVSTTNTIADATAYNIIATRLGAALKLQTNGAFDNIAAGPQGAADVAAGVLSVSNLTGTGDAFIGNIGDWAVFEGALTEKEKAYLWNSGSPRTYAQVKAAAGF